MRRKIMGEMEGGNNKYGAPFVSLPVADLVLVTAAAAAMVPMTPRVLAAFEELDCWAATPGRERRFPGAGMEGVAIRGEPSGGHE